MLLWALAIIAIVVVVAAVVRRGVLGERLTGWAARRRARRAELGVSRCANCGYPLKGLEIPRCPECGALRAFKKPLDELGLTEDEVREGFARRKRERDRQQSHSEDKP